MPVGSQILYKTGQSSIIFSTIFLECHLFSTTCSATNITLSVNNDCRLFRFPYLKDDLEGLFAWGTSLTGADTDQISNVIADVTGNNENCNFHNSTYYT